MACNASVRKGKRLKFKRKHPSQEARNKTPRKQKEARIKVNEERNEIGSTKAKIISMND